MLQEGGLTIDRDAKDLLVSLIGGDRLASRGEIAKLALYAKGQGRVTLDDVRLIVGDASALALDDVVDATLAANAPAAAAALAKARGAATRADAVLGALLRGLTSLHQMALAVEAGGSIDRVIDQQKPAVHFSRKPHLERALRNFTAGNACAPCCWWTRPSSWSGATPRWRMPSPNAPCCASPPAAATPPEPIRPGHILPCAQAPALA